MRFVLTYDGLLPPDGNPSVKHGIRKQFHPQLKRQWEVEPSLVAWTRGEVGFIGGYGSPRIPTITRGGFNFTPLVTKEMRLVCSLDITFMRPEEPGGVIRHGGDIDNRIKTLFDSLTVPKENQITVTGPGAGEDPFYCLLEDDALVTGFRVSTERLLIPPASPPVSSVRLVIAVLVRPSEVTNENARFLGGYLS